MYQIVNKKHNPVSTWEKIRCLMPSGYIRKGTLQVFHKIRRNYPDDYIVCIGYTYGNAYGDTQFALTETFKTYETSVDEVIDRCLREECSVERVGSTGASTSFVYNEKYATIHCVPMRVTENFRSCEPVVSAEDVDRDDDKSRKLVLILHGPLHTIQQVFANFYSSEDDIFHLVVIPVWDVSNIFPKLFPLSLYPQQKQNNYHYHHYLHAAASSR